MVETSPPPGTLMWNITLIYSKRLKPPEGAIMQGWNVGRVLVPKPPRKKHVTPKPGQVHIHRDYKLHYAKRSLKSFFWYDKDFLDWGGGFFFLKAGIILKNDGWPFTWRHQFWACQYSCWYWQHRISILFPTSTFIIRKTSEGCGPKFLWN